MLSGMKEEEEEATLNQMLILSASMPYRLSRALHFFLAVRCEMLV